jgi:hypothetical protein
MQGTGRVGYAPRTGRLVWSDVLLTIVLVTGGVYEVATGLAEVFAPGWVGKDILELTPVCGAASESADDTVYTVLSALGGSRIDAGLLMLSLGIYRTHVYATYMPLNPAYHTLVQLVLAAAAVGPGIGLIGTLSLKPVSSQITMGIAPLVRLGVYAVAFIVSMCVFESSSLYKEAHRGYPQEAGEADANKGPSGERRIILIRRA